MGRKVCFISGAPAGAVGGEGGHMPRGQSPPGRSVGRTQKEPGVRMQRGGDKVRDSAVGLWTVLLKWVWRWLCRFHCFKPT